MEEALQRVNTTILERVQGNMMLKFAEMIPLRMAEQGVDVNCVVKLRIFMYSYIVFSIIVLTITLCWIGLLERRSSRVFLYEVKGNSINKVTLSQFKEQIYTSLLWYYFPFQVCLG